MQNDIGKWIRTSALAASIIALAGCGGGGDSGGAVVSTESFPLQAAVRARVTTGASDSFTVSGTCTGTATITTGPAAPATFEGISGYAATQTATINVTNCPLASGAVSGTAYFDGSYSPLGYSIPGVEYAKFVTPPPPLPTTVRVGDTAVYSTQTTYTDSTKTVVTGQSVLSYVVEADTANTAIVNFISRDYDTASQLLATEQNRYRIAVDGTVVVVTSDVQYSTTSTAHLIFTKV